MLVTQNLEKKPQIYSLWFFYLYLNDIYNNEK
jgi:hypothetical protein